MVINLLAIIRVYQILL